MAAITMGKPMYISLTALKLRRPWHVFSFYRHAIPSLRQAKATNGCLMAEPKFVEGYHCTLSAWESRSHMLSFLQCSVHRKAMRQFSSIAMGMTYGYEDSSLPTWPEVMGLLGTFGRRHE